MRAREIFGRAARERNGAFVGARDAEPFEGSGHFAAAPLALFAHVGKKLSYAGAGRIQA